MTDETNAPAETQAGGETVDEPKKIDADEPEAKVEEPKADGGGNNSGDDKGEDDTDDESEKPKKPSGAKRAKIREEYLRNENAELLRRIEELSRASKPEAKEEAPREEDFNGDWTAYVAAKAAHEAAKAVGKTLADREKSELDRRRADVIRERDIAHMERVEEARTTIADFDAVMATMKGVTVRDAVLEEIKSSDKSPLLAYHLAKNPNKLHELNSMSDRELAREIGRLEGSIRMPAGKKQTTAPPPPSNLKGGAAPPTDLASADMESYVAARKAQGYGRH